MPASTWGFTKVWDTPGKEEVAKWSSAPASIEEVFNQIGGQKTFQDWVRNTILPNRPVFTPPPGYHYTYRARYRAIPLNLPYRSQGERVTQLELPSGGRRAIRGHR